MPGAGPSSVRKSSISRIERTIVECLGHAPPHKKTVDALQIDHLGKRYGETIALDDASVVFEPGTVHTILGENGSGKSTMLKLLSGVVSPTSGSVSINGRPVTAQSPRDMQAYGLGTVFQEVLVAPHRSVIENIFLGYDGPLRRNIDRDARRNVAKAVLDQIATLAIDVDAPASSLPLAAQQLVVLARAFVRLPAILLLDEATAALDYGDREKVFQTVEDYAAAGNIVIFISHRMEEVKRLSHRVTVLRSGRIVETLEKDQITAELLLALMAPEVHVDVR